MEQEQKRLLIRGARILNPARGEDYIGNILISGDRISAVSENLYDADAEVIEAKGLTAVPGFVDMHVHLRDPGFTDKEDIYTGCRAAAAGGKAPFDRRAAAITKGLKGEELCDLEALHDAGAIALSDDGRPVIDTACLVKALCEAPKLHMRVTAHCEDLFLAKKWVMHEGEVSEKLNLPGVPAAAEDCGTAREIAAAAAYDVPVHICHVTAA